MSSRIIFTRYRHQSHAATAVASALRCARTSFMCSRVCAGEGAGGAVFRRQGKQPSCRQDEVLEIPNNTTNNTLTYARMPGRAGAVSAAHNVYAVSPEWNTKFPPSLSGLSGVRVLVQYLCALLTRDMWPVCVCAHAYK